MNRFFIHSKTLFIFTLAFFFVFSTQAGSKKRKKLKSSISEAMVRSNKDQDRIRNKMNMEADDRIRSWKERQMDAISISNSGSAHDAVRVGGSPDLSMYDMGEDHSGLDQLHSEVEEESTDINFDEELREVSSKKD